jgi:hypothetical protein
MSVVVIGRAVSVCAPSAAVQTFTAFAIHSSRHYASIFRRGKRVSEITISATLLSRSEWFNLCCKDVSDAALGLEKTRRTGVEFELPA